MVLRIRVFCVCGDISGLPHGRHTFGIECKGVLSTRVLGMLVGNRVGVGLIRSTINAVLPCYFPVKGAKK